MTPIAKRPEPVVYLEHRSDELIRFFTDLLRDIEAGNLEPVKTEIRNAIHKVRNDARARGFHGRRRL